MNETNRQIVTNLYLELHSVNFVKNIIFENCL